MATLSTNQNLKDCVENFWPNRSSDARTRTGNYIYKDGKKVTETFRFIENGSISERGIRKCIERATIDITTRTMKATHSSKSNWMFWFAKEIADKGSLCKNIIGWFNRSSTQISETEFDAWHRQACEKSLSVIRSNYKNKDGTEVNYGKAQKVVNMTMKTIYCLLLSEPNHVQILYEPYFEHCHMPLDRIILDGWFDDTKKGLSLISDEKYDAKNRSGWSDINYSDSTYDENGKYSYMCIVKEIRDLIDSKSNIAHKNKHGNIQAKYNGYTALQAEFLIWPDYRPLFY